MDIKHTREYYEVHFNEVKGEEKKVLVVTIICTVFRGENNL